MFKRLDLYLLDKFFEPLARVVNRKIGFSNYTLAKWFLMFATAFMVFSAYAWISVGVKDSPSTFLLMVALDLFHIWPALRAAMRMESEYRNPIPGRLPPNLRDPEPTSNERRLVIKRQYGLDVVILLIFATVWVLGIEVSSAVSGAGYTSLRTGNAFFDFYFLLKTSWVTGTAGMYFLACVPQYPRDQKERVPIGLQPIPVRN